MKIRYIVFLVLSVALILLTMGVSSGTDALVFFDLPSIVAVVGLASFLSLSSFGFREIASFFRIALGRSASAGQETETVGKAVVFFGTLQWYLALTAIIGPMIGVVSVLSHLDDNSAIGRGIAMALLTALYSLILMAVVAVPCHAASRKRLVEDGVTIGDTV